MTKQFAYQDAHGTIYPAHQALAFQPGLVPGWYDTDTRTFTPNGNPQEQRGTIMTDAEFGDKEKVLSGLAEDKGADTAPAKGVHVSGFESQGDAAETDAHIVELEQENAELRNRLTQLEAEAARKEIEEQSAAPADPAYGEGGDASTDTQASATDGVAPAAAAPVADVPAKKVVRRGRPAKAQ